MINTGKGIFPENMKKLFQPLFTAITKGIGLGLEVCKNMAEPMAAGSRWESEWGKRTTFSAILPVARDKG